MDLMMKEAARVAGKELAGVRFATDCKEDRKISNAGVPPGCFAKECESL